MNGTPPGVGISVRDVHKRYGQVEAVRGVSIDIREGEFLTMLGPSGCGKTTTLRMIAGFEEPDSGAIHLRGEDVTDVPPNRRNVNMVFQHYALFPHLSIEENVAYGLKIKKVPKPERRARVEEMLSIVRLEGMHGRKPTQLSGGQQQRVALARALVNRPAALLLDEPLGALDVKLRKQMQLELKRIQHELGTTFVYVTHDQEEALSMSDRIAVMNGGLVEQIDAPRAIYEHPATPFVADFVGVLNALEIRVDEAADGRVTMRVGDRERIVVRTGEPGSAVGSTLTIAVRPERVRLAQPGEEPAGSAVAGTVHQVVYLGTLTQFHVETSTGASLIAHRLSDGTTAAIGEGDRVVLAWDEDDAAILRG